MSQTPPRAPHPSEPSTRKTPPPPATTDRVAPHNLDAEEALLGAAMTTPDALEVAATEVETEDFYKSAHRHVHRVLRDMWEAGMVKVDTVLVADELATQGLLEAVGGGETLMGIKAVCPDTTHASKYARIVTEHATLRRLIQAASEIVGMAYERPENVSEACDMARHMIATVELDVGIGAPSPDVDAFLAVDDVYDWLVPGLLERRDRVIITGGEGGGKSTFLRQLAVMGAAGLHPFDYRHIDPVRALVVDVENSPAQIRRAIEPLANVARRRTSWDPDNLRIETRPEGLDLTQRHDSRWLLERVASNRPDVLVIGPLYKLHAEDPNDEMPARKVARVLDMVRGKYDCSILLEAHAPHGGGEGRSRSLRPYGSSLWLRWPEFGYGLRPSGDEGTVEGRARTVFFDPWRGARDARAWPVKLSTDGAEFWPFRDATRRPVTPV